MNEKQEPIDHAVGTQVKSGGERLNFIIAFCAVLISAASFYATYLQAEAANKQVKAMTLPMIQFTHGNIMGDDEKVINFILRNAGVGPALIKSVSFTYKDKSYDTVFDIVKDCCQEDLKKYLSITDQSDSQVPQFITSQVVNDIIPGQDENVFLKLKLHEDNQIIWNLLNEIRFDLGFNACYCSMLDECYQVDVNAIIQGVKVCK